LIEIPGGSIVSEHLGLHPSIFGELEARFPVFLKAHKSTIIKEFLIPEVVELGSREGPGSWSSPAAKDGME
jgi:hypothetical protein